MQSIGFFIGKNPVCNDFKSKIGLLDLYGRWLEESIVVLERNHYLRRDGESYSVIEKAPIDIDLVWDEWNREKDVWLEDPNMKAQVVLVEKALRALPEILLGKIPATDVLFPNSSMDLVKGIYTQNPVANHFNEVLANNLVTYIKGIIQQDQSAQIRILEVGAGTGGTSAKVFQKLMPYQDYIQEYCYTDISKAFLMHAEKEYGSQNPYLTYQIFNVEEPAATQGIDANKYDVVIATNVLHATQNIRQTLRNVKVILNKQGLLLLNEMSHNSVFFHLTFGLLEGWWLYEDSELRIPGCPGLYPETWKSVLEGEGFKSLAFPAESFHELGHQIIVAKSDGVVRQKRQFRQTPPRTFSLKHNSETTALSLKFNAPIKGVEGITQEILREKSTMFMKKLVGETLRIPSHKIDSSEPFEKYGIDSILVVQLTNNLAKVLGSISSTLFFEYRTVDALVEHFMKTKKDALMTLVGLESQAVQEGIFDEESHLQIKPSQRVQRKTKWHLPLYDSNVKEPEATASIVQDVAIIGLSGRYPEATDVNEFWKNLKEGKNCIIEIPKDRWDWKKYFDQRKGNRGTMYTKWGGFIKDIDKFDPLFFHISPKEAEQMDPQERLFLETAYASIEDAGYTPTTFCDSRKVGVFVGVMNGKYSTGAKYWSIANRVSYIFNFQGPSMTVDTACSSSLTAIHLALESIYSGMSECAIAGGVNLIVDPAHYLNLSEATMLSASNQCKAFGDKADGFVDGEGVGAIILKPLQKAITDGDHIYGIIKGSMLNAGGRTHGYTVPNPNSQYELISEALKRANVDARAISCLEAHGTGTALGDPIEIAGLKKVFEQNTQDKQFCSVGSVKSNIGHCESAAGIAGITKILLQLKHKQLVPSLHSKVLNPNIDFSNTPFVVQQELTEWERPVLEINGEAKECSRIAGISSFGAGGSNAHVVIEEYIPEDKGKSQVTINSRNPAIIVLSAKNEERLKEKARDLLNEIQNQAFSDSSLADIAYTLQVGREAMEERLAFIVGSMKELQEKLHSFVEGEKETPDLYRGQVKRNKEALSIFTTDKDLHQTIYKWVEQGKYVQFINLWVKGLDVNWDKFYEDDKPCRISLPTYPFAKERYWIPSEGGNTSN
ncbi:beta-ketoacyl synthase N-terminal-like domain-containing protein, partial [Bacillus wiedmannii]|uniref:beta-ketoacyl synthase N-terminal-like domain-containing protein n=1 Tax=Bacillus wiedmannii TaxID=1890302 RepID=UPI00211D4551